MKGSDMIRSCTTVESVRNAYKVLGGKADRSRPLERHKCGWRDAIKIDFKQVIWEGLYWICLP
jgi:hypothetical protein